MSVLDRGALEASPLADLHAIASELSIDGFRRLRRAELIEAILQRQGDGAPAEEPAEPREEAAPEEAAAEPVTPRRRGRRGGRGRGGQAAASPEPVEDTEDQASYAPVEGAEPQGQGAQETGPELDRPEEEIVEGVVDLIPGGSGFVRVNPPDPSDEDVYISSAQVKRCELVSGDRVSGPRRAPRRSERFASLVRVETVNGRPVGELTGVRFDELPLAFPSRRLELSGATPSLDSVERAAPIGRGSRVTIVGPPCSGKTELLRGLAGALAKDESLQPWLVLVGVRPEEIPQWRSGPLSPAVALSFGASGDVQGQALEGVVEQVRRMVARGSDAVVLIDTLDGVPGPVARKALASARNVVDGGSLTVIATASAPLGGETTLIALERTPSGVFPAIDPSLSWTIRRELLG